MDALPLISVVRVGQRYFDVVGVRVIEGRALTADDLRQRDGVVVNERFARMHFHDEPVMGRRLLLIDERTRRRSRRGPLDDHRRRGGQRAATLLAIGGVRSGRLRIVPEDPPPFIQIVARSSSGPAAAAAFVRDEMRALDRDLPVFGMNTVDEFLASQQWPQRLFGSMFAVFASIAMLLATCGLYAVTAYAVSRRTRRLVYAWRSEPMRGASGGR